VGLVVTRQRRVTVIEGHTPAPPPEVVGALGQLDELVQMFTEHPDEGVQEAVVGLLRAVDVLHRGAWRRLAAFLDERSLLDEALADPHLALLFELYEPVEDGDEHARAETAVARVRPYVESRGGQIEVVAAEGGVVNIRLLAAPEDVSGSGATLGHLVENVLRAELPDFVRMQMSPSVIRPHRPNPVPVVIRVSSVTRRARDGRREDGGASEDGSIRG
jgi:Fe-S cluster biogenesis protein NfuA